MDSSIIFNPSLSNSFSMVSGGRNFSTSSLDPANSMSNPWLKASVDTSLQNPSDGICKPYINPLPRILAFKSSYLLMISFNFSFSISSL